MNADKKNLRLSLIGVHRRSSVVPSLLRALYLCSNRPITMKWFLIYILLLATAAPALAQEVKTVDGHTYLGTVGLFDDQVTVKIGDRETRIDPANLLEATFNSAVKTHSKPVVNPDPVIPADGHGWL